ncbi:hypothetical protein BW13_11430 [Bifidobacterium sp. UTCIF-37]|nr:hypothetical protein BW13_11430 [Bifidobacterium sp. UTCIF-37]TPF87291.1 hypothetical protein BW11_11295 [Bifidobacterium sp. UTCIF-38]
MGDSLKQSKRSMIDLCTTTAKKLGQPLLFGLTTSLVLQEVPLPTCDLDMTVLHTVSSSPDKRIRRNASSTQVQAQTKTQPHVWKLLNTERILRINKYVFAVDLFSTWAQMADHVDLTQLVILGDSIINAVEQRQPATLRGNGATLRDKLIDMTLELSPFRGKRLCTLAAPLLMPNVASPKESEIRLELLRHGVPLPQTNYVVPNATFKSGIAMTLDLAWPEFRVAVEYDGDQHRTDKAQWYRDQQKRDWLQNRGWLISIANASTLADEASREEFAWRLSRNLIANGARFTFLLSPSPLDKVSKRIAKQLARGQAESNPTQT